MELKNTFSFDDDRAVTVTITADDIEVVVSEQEAGDVLRQPARAVIGHGGFKARDGIKVLIPFEGLDRVVYAPIDWEEWQAICGLFAQYQFYSEALSRMQETKP